MISFLPFNIMFYQEFPCNFPLSDPYRRQKHQIHAFCARTADPAPLSPAPSITIFLLILLSDLKRHYTYYCQNNCHYPEPCDDLRFRITFFLIMMMKRSHQEYSSSCPIFSFCSFKPAHLKYNRKVFNKEYPAKDGYQAVLS